MKKLIAAFCTAALALNMTLTVFAAPSIGSLIPEAPRVVEGEIPAGLRLVVQEVDTKSYEDEAVADIVESFNDEEKDVTIMDVLETLKVDTKKVLRTVNKKLEVRPEEYEAIIPFVDLVLTDGQLNEYEMENKVKVTFTLETAKELKKEDLVIMLIDQKKLAEDGQQSEGVAETETEVQAEEMTEAETERQSEETTETEIRIQDELENSKVYFVDIEEYNPKTGEITAIFPVLGPFTVLEKGEK